MYEISVQFEDIQVKIQKVNRLKVQKIQKIKIHWIYSQKNQASQWKPRILHNPYEQIQFEKWECSFLTFPNQYLPAQS